MINEFRISYSDFELGQIIEPDEFDINNHEIVQRINVIIEVLNQITDGIGGSGAEIIDVGVISPFTSNKLQGLLQELITRLRSYGENSGSKFIGSSEIEGVDGNNIYSQLSSLKNLLDILDNHVVGEVNRLDSMDSTLSGYISDIESLLSDLDSRVSSNEGELLSKLGTSDSYNKTELDGKFSEVNEGISDNTDLINKRTVKDGNHEGTWQGFNVSDLASIYGVDNVIVSTTKPSNGSNGDLWFNPITNQYQLFHNGMFRLNGTAMNVKKIEERISSSQTATITIPIEEYDSSLDTLIMFRNSTFLKEGIDYNISSDGSKIIKTSGQWDNGTVFDFIVLKSIPLVEGLDLSNLVNVFDRLDYLENKVSELESRL